MTNPYISHISSSQFPNNLTLYLFWRMLGSFKKNVGEEDVQK